MDKYQKELVVGEGTYGVVSKATVKETGRKVAIKKIRVKGKAKDGVHFSALREIKALQELHHENVIELVDVFSHNGNIYLVFDLMEWDLEIVIKEKSLILSHADIKSYMFMLLKGVEHCHANWVLHRDLKPNNLLLRADGILKISDFGLARAFGSPDRNYTHEAVTRWYRPPELLFGARKYGSSVDMWSIGCIFAELMLRTPYFPGSSDIDQLGKIFAALGTPTEAIWPGFTSLPHYVPFQSFPPTPFKVLFTAAPDDALDLLEKLLAYDPNRRISATEALKHPYFSNAPFATAPHLLPKPPAHATFENMKRGAQPTQANDSKRRSDFDDEAYPEARKKLDFS